MVTWTKCFNNYAQDDNERETMIWSKQETGWTAPQTALEHSALQSEDIEAVWKSPGQTVITIKNI